MASNGDSFDKENPVIKLIIIYIYFLFHVKMVLPVLTKIVQFIDAIFKSIGVKIHNVYHLIKPVLKTVGCIIQSKVKSFLCFCQCFFSSVSSVLKSKSVKKSLSPLRTGNYYTNGVWYNQKLIVDRSRSMVKGTCFGDSHDAKIEIGNLGEADPEIVEATGQDFYNMKLTIDNYQMTTEYGVVSQDGAKITMKGTTDSFVLNWITQEEADALDADGDPVEAPPCPYKIQPDNPGKFLWLTGPGGTGKSTSAQMLGKTAGYVYYEGDCFRTCKNPYLPLDAAEPGMVQYQRNLIGEGLDARGKAHQKTIESFEKVMLGEDFVMEDYKEYYGMMCEDIKKERNRIGGDWVVAQSVLNRETRDFLRSCLGPELVFVILNMEEEELTKRILRRHPGDSSLNEEVFKRMMAVTKLSEPAGDDEENALEVMLTHDMTKEDVANKILQTVEQFKM